MKSESVSLNPFRKKILNSTAIWLPSICRKLKYFRCRRKSLKNFFRSLLKKSLLVTKSRVLQQSSKNRFICLLFIDVSSSRGPLMQPKYWHNNITSFLFPEVIHKSISNSEYTLFSWPNDSESRNVTTYVSGLSKNYTRIAGPHMSSTSSHTFPSNFFFSLYKVSLLVCIFYISSHIFCILFARH